MLRVSSAQMVALVDAAQSRFEDEMVAHCRQFSPRLANVLGARDLRTAVRTALARAAEYGFSNRGPARLYLELTMLFGSSFDDDPQYPWASHALAGAGDQMTRAARLHSQSLVCLAVMGDVRAAEVMQGLARLRAMQPVENRLSSDRVAMIAIEAIGDLFPQRAAYVGQPALIALAERARAIADAIGFTGWRAPVLLTAMMFGFGHGCADDPLYPWIRRTLTDTRIVDPESRAARLERKAVVWLEHALAGQVDPGEEFSP